MTSSTSSISSVTSPGAASSGASYLLPCDCGAKVAVSPGQAGGQTRCGGCGREMAVPKLRDLGRLERCESARVATAAWRPAHAVVLLGSLAGIVGLGAAAWLGRGPANAVDERALRAMINAADDTSIYKVWSERLAESTVRRPAADEELAVLRQDRFATALSRGFSLVAGLGIAAALLAALAIAMAPDPKPQAGPARGGP